MDYLKGPRGLAELSPVAVARAGVLSCLDGYMNIALEQTEEYVNGQKTNDYGDAFVRGNNGESPLDLLFFSPAR